MRLVQGPGVRFWHVWPLWCLVLDYGTSARPNPSPHCSSGWQDQKIEHHCYSSLPPNYTSLYKSSILTVNMLKEFPLILKVLPTSVTFRICKMRILLESVVLLDLEIKFRCIPCKLLWRLSACLKYQGSTQSLPKANEVMDPIVRFWLSEMIYFYQHESVFRFILFIHFYSLTKQNFGMISLISTKNLGNIILPEPVDHKYLPIVSW